MDGCPLFAEVPWPVVGAYVDRVSIGKHGYPRDNSYEKRLFTAAKLTRIRIYIGVSINNFVRFEIICRAPARMTHETRLARTAQGANYPGQFSCLDSDIPRIPRISRTLSVGHTTHINTHNITHPFRRTYHAYHAYHAPFSSAPFHHPEARYTHNFKRRLKQRT